MAAATPQASASPYAALQGAKQSPLQTSALESHEGITISARPWTDAALYKQKFPKKSPFAAGVLAVQVAFRNDSDQSVKVGLDRIRLSFTLEDDSRQELEPMKAADVADAILRPGGKDPIMSQAARSHHPEQQQQRQGLYRATKSSAKRRRAFQRGSRPQHRTRPFVF